MNEFEKRWRLGAAVAHRQAGGLSTEAPLGFATRVFALAQQQGTTLSFASLWQATALRALGALTLLLVILVTYDRLAAAPDEFAPPEIESEVAESIVML